MTEPWQIHVCPVHGPRTPTMLGDCPVGCCAEAMEVVPVVRDTRGDGVGVIERKWTLKGGYSRDGNWPDEPTRLMTLVESGPTLSMRETVEVVPAEQLRGAVEERDKLLRRALRALGGEGRTSRHLVAQQIEAFLLKPPAGGQSTAEEAFEQSGGGETLEEAQARQLRGEHAFSPQPESPLGTDEEGRSDV
jgi:hypothetical protein